MSRKTGAGCKEISLRSYFLAVKYFQVCHSLPAGRDWLKFQTKRGDVQQSVVTFVGNAILFWYFMRKMTKIKIMLTKHLKMWYDLYSVV